MDNSVTNTIFTDRTEAGKSLAKILSEYRLKNAVVLNIPFGGEPIGYEISRTLHIPLDTVVASKLKYPDDNGVVVAGVSEGDIAVFDNLLIEQLAVDHADLDTRLYTKMLEINRLIGVFRSGLPLPDLQGFTVILVNDGVESGVTMLSAVEHVKSLRPERIIIAVPVISQEACPMLKEYVDEVVYLSMQGTLTLTAQWYTQYDAINEEKAKQILEKATKELRSYLETNNLDASYSLPFHLGSIPPVTLPKDKPDTIGRNVM